MAKVYDAIVVGSGAAGGMAAKTLTEAGLEVLMLEGGPDPASRPLPPKVVGEKAPESRADVLLERAFAAREMLVDAADRMQEFARGKPNLSQMGHLRASDVNYDATFAPERQVVQKHCRGYGEGSASLYIDDVDHPYLTPAANPFMWIRSRQLGGRTQTWKRVSPRLRAVELEAPSRDGHGIPWPISYEELRPYYERAERVLRVVGSVEAGAEAYAGSLSPRAMTDVERDIKAGVEGTFPKRRVHLAPFATPLGPEEDEATLDARINADHRGHDVPWDVSVRHSIASARATGKLEVRCGAAVSHVILDRDTGRAAGVGYVDTETGAAEEARAKAVVLAASTLESTRILLNSETLEGERGLANSSGCLGRYLVDHMFGVGVVAYTERRYVPQGFPDLFVPPFRNQPGEHQRRDFLRSYHLYGEIRGIRGGPSRRWITALVLSAQGETLGHAHNRVRLSPHTVDAHGIPVLEIDYRRGDNEVMMAKDMLQTTDEVATAAGFEVEVRSDQPLLPGRSVHELGTARMGSDPKSSVCNPHGRTWDVDNVYIADGAVFPTSGSQNPTLTIMALAARACDDLVERAKRGEL